MLYRVQIVFDITIDSKRGVNIYSTDSWSLLIISKDNNTIVIDGNLNMPGEVSYAPQIRLLKEVEEP